MLFRRKVIADEIAGIEHLELQTPLPLLLHLIDELAQVHQLIVDRTLIDVIDESLAKLMSLSYFLIF